MSGTVKSKRPIATALLTAVVAVTGLAAVPAPADARDKDWRHWRNERHHRDHDWRRHQPNYSRYYQRRWHRRSNDWVGPGIAGFAAGALLGGVVAPNVYSPPRVIYTPRGHRPWTASWYRYCENRYRSFDPASGTFLGYDGRRHMCR